MRHQLTTFRVCCLCLLLPLTCSPGAPAQVTHLTLMPRAAQASQQTQGRMEELARRLNLGARRADSARPQPTRSGADTSRLGGYYQCFERGCVYDGRGIHAVSGAIFRKYVAEGYERGPLGFPTYEERACAQPAGSRYQIFEGGRIVLNAATGAADAYPNPSTVGVFDDCRAPSARSAAGANESARFRVTLNGFAVNRQTFDHALDADGKGDEVFFLTEVGRFRRDARAQFQLLPSRVMGDANGQTGRLLAGSASALGGLRAGDRFPSPQPWALAGSPKADELPMLLWEGELVKGESWVVIAPTVWEWDNGDQNLRAQWGVNIENHLKEIFTPERLEAISRALYFSTRGGGSGGVGRELKGDVFGTAEDRPVGMERRGGHDTFYPMLLVLTYENALRAAAESHGNKGAGVLEINTPTATN